ncbi:WD40-repeat-containing domain protein [Globomyces pollinis-pini]|nr:WD40-repeat-containing domain protein [Globomyces pollinis-pini]
MNSESAIDAVDCFPSERLLAYATHSHIHIDAGDSVNVQVYPIGCRATALKWSPTTSESNIQLVAAFEDGSIMLFDKTSMAKLNQIKLGHVNDLAFNENGDFLAVVGDDKLLRIWKMSSLNDEPLQVNLRSRGVSVSWHKHNAAQLLVGEVNGLIRLFDISSNQFVFSAYVPGTELTVASWNPESSEIFSAIIDSNWYIWDLEKSNFPHFNGTSLPGSNQFKWSISNSRTFAIGTDLPDMPANSNIQLFPSLFTKVPITLSIPNKGRMTCFSWISESQLCIGTTRGIVLLDV